MKNFKLYFIYTNYFKGYQKMEKLQQKFYKKSNTKPWPLSIKDAIFCLEEIPYAQDSSSIFPKIDSSADLVNKIRDWDLSMLSKSSLYFYLMANRRGREIRKGPNYIQYEWHYRTPLILNPRIGKEVVSILLMRSKASHTSLLKSKILISLVLLLPSFYLNTRNTGSFTHFWSFSSFTDF